MVQCVLSAMIPGTSRKTKLIEFYVFAKAECQNWKGFSSQLENAKRCQQISLTFSSFSENSESFDIAHAL